jgi:hypothetical protein
VVEIVNDEEGRPPQWRAGWQGGDTGVVPGCWRSLLECGGCGAARCGGGVQLLGFEVNRSALVWAVLRPGVVTPLGVYGCPQADGRVHE